MSQIRNYINEYNELQSLIQQAVIKAAELADAAPDVMALVQVAKSEDGATVPFMSKGRFKELVGAVGGKDRVLDGWIDKRYIPTLQIGRHKVIDMIELRRQVVSGELDGAGGAA